ncbi:hypothetical protein Ahy_B06g081660 isoform B [Arachis hypogaea]|uniref:Protein FAR1-RELATED SEQUENCE n=1 Tax=Arachis hypogaea TaxID=3818 RepID=A0A444YLK0_ARAHY|nr:hypothetical protein Ahy_B06g081660 isoform B [Arachis hypogaea]
MDNVAPKYILEHWSKNIKKRNTHIKSSQDEPLLELRSKRFDDLVFRSQIYANLHPKRSKGKSLLSHEEATLSDLQSPPHVRIRGWPKNRLGSNLEKKISNATKKKKKPSPNVGSMIYLSSSFYNALDMNYPGEEYRSFNVNLQKGLERAVDGFESFMASDSRITWSLILSILCNRMFGPYSRLKPSISSYNSIERN